MSQSNVIRGRFGRPNRMTAYDLFMAADKLDEDPKTVGEAASLYEEAIRLDPQFAPAYVGLGCILYSAGKASKAVDCYQKALEINPRQFEALYNLGVVFRDMGEPATALDYFTAALDQAPRDASTHFNLAMTFEELGEAHAARAHWTRYLALKPEGRYADIARAHLETP